MFADFADNFVNLFEKGGVAMYPLFLCAFISIYVCTEKIFCMRIGVLLNCEVLVLWKTGLQKDEFREFSAPDIQKSLLFVLMKKLFPLLPLPESLLHEKIREQFIRIRHSLEQRLNWLEIVTNISPLLGLLGTALGMLEIFSVLSDKNVTASTLSIGISEALVTTITGLAIAIPSLIAHNLFQKKSEQILFGLEVQTNELILEFRDKFMHIKE